MNPILNWLKRLPETEPAMLIAVGFVVVLTGYKVFGPEHMPITDVFSQEYATYVGALVAGILTRLQVMSPDTWFKHMENQDK